METEPQRRRREHRAEVTERAVLIDTLLEPLGDLDQLRDDIAEWTDSAESTEELRYALFYSWQCGFKAGQRQQQQ